MKKLLNISVIAALAILPLAANATDLTTEQMTYADPTTDNGTTVATTKYVKGAYKELGTAINTKQDKLSTEQLSAIQNVSTLNTRLGTAETDISALKTAVGDATSGLTKDVSALKTAVGDATSGLVKDVAEMNLSLATKADAETTYTKTDVDTKLAEKQDKLSDTQLNAVNSGITSEKVTSYDNLVAASEDFITKDVNDLTNYTTTTDMDTLLNAKADAETTYTKEEVDTKLADKQDKLLEAQLNAVNSGITSEKVIDYDNLLQDSANYATKTGVTATINASNVTVPVLTTWGDNTATNMEASIAAATYTEPAPAVEQH